MKPSCALGFAAVLLAILVRWLVSIYPYSGYQMSPMHGDFEAQRHWMEITYHLPPKEWYVNTTKNDLQYWGLDYPPLTAYHSWIMGAISHRINPQWVALGKSRGYETEHHKLFMRLTVMVADILIYIPAIVIYFCFIAKIPEQSKKLTSMTVALLCPSFILIDHGHFQYNCISLGFALWAVIALSKGYDLIGSIAFCLALNYKQMELYHALPFFCYLLGSCFKQSLGMGLMKLVKLANVVLVTFVICWIPFWRNWLVLFDVIKRLFPFERGIFEDKVANFWCCINVLIKLKQWPQILLTRISLLVTLAFLLPLCWNLLRRPTIHRFKLAMINSSLIFFLFSFQVHEKSILLTSLPMLLFTYEEPLMTTWFGIISTYSMLPLLLKDRQLIPYIACQGLYSISSYMYMLYSNKHISTERNFKMFGEKCMKILFTVSMLGMIVLTVTSLIVQPPSHLPDLWPLLNCLYSCGHYFLFLGYFTIQQLTTRDDSPDFTTGTQSERKARSKYSRVKKEL